MAKPRMPIEGSLAEELYSAFLKFIGTENAIPMERAFWRWLVGNGYYTSKELPLHVFRYQFGRLAVEGWIEIERTTRAISPKRNVSIRVDP